MIKIEGFASRAYKNQWQHKLQIHAYVLMTNHAYLLATPTTENSIPKVIQFGGRRYMQYFNYMYLRAGALWEVAIKPLLVIGNNTYLSACDI